jgi:hypothetical protein
MNKDSVLDALKKASKGLQFISEISVDDNLVKHDELLCSSAESFFVKIFLTGVSCVGKTGWTGSLPQARRGSPSKITVTRARHF